MTNIQSSLAWRPPPKAMVNLQVGEESVIKNIEASQLLDQEGNLSYEKLLEYSFRYSSLNGTQDTSQINWKLHRDKILSSYEISTLYLDDDSNWVIFSSDDEFVTAFKKAEQKAKALGKPIFPNFSCYSIKNWRIAKMFPNSNCAVTILKCKTKTEKKIHRPKKKARKAPKILKELKNCVLTVGECVHNIIEESIRLQQKITKDVAHIALSSNLNEARKNRDVALTEDAPGVVLLTLIEGFSPKNVLEVVTELGSTIDTWILAVGGAVHNVVEGGIYIGKSMKIKHKTNSMLKAIVSSTVEVFTDNFDEPQKNRVDAPKKYSEVRYRNEMAESKFFASDFAISVIETPKSNSTKRTKTAPLLSDMLITSSSNSVDQCVGAFVEQPSDKDLDTLVSWYKTTTAVQTKKKKIKVIPVRKNQSYGGTERHAPVKKDLDLFLSFSSFYKNKLYLPSFLKTLDKSFIPDKDVAKLMAWWSTSDLFLRQKIGSKPFQDFVTGRFTDSSFERLLAWVSPLESHTQTIYKGKVNKKRTHEEFKEESDSNEKNGPSVKIYDDDDDGKLSDEALEQFLSRWSIPKKNTPYRLNENSGRNKVIPGVAATNKDELSGLLDKGNNDEDHGQLYEDALEQFLSRWSIPKKYFSRDTKENSTKSKLMSNVAVVKKENQSGLSNHGNYDDDDKLSNEALQHFLSWWPTPVGTIPHNSKTHNSKRETEKNDIKPSTLKTEKEYQSGRLNDATFDLFLEWWSTSEKKRFAFAAKTRDVFNKRISNLPRKQSDKKTIQSHETCYEMKEGTIDKFASWWSTSAMNPTVSNTKKIPAQVNNGQLSDDDFERFLAFWSPDFKPALREKVQADPINDLKNTPLSEKDFKEVQYSESQDSNVMKYFDHNVENSSALEHSSPNDKESDEMSVSDLETISDVSAQTLKNEEDEEMKIIDGIEVVLTDGHAVVHSESSKSDPHEITDDEWSDDFDFDVQSVESALSEEHLVSSIDSSESDVLVKAPPKCDEVISINSSDNEEDGDGFSLISEQDFKSDGSISFVSDLELTESINSGI
jgi:hypothetical protein